MSEIVKWLREAAAIGLDMSPGDLLAGEALNTIEALERRVAELEGALEAVDRHARKHIKSNHTSQTAALCVILSITAEPLQACAALAKEKP